MGAGMATWQNCQRYPTQQQRQACQQFIEAQYQMYEQYLKQQQQQQQTITEPHVFELAMEPRAEAPVENPGNFIVTSYVEAGVEAAKLTNRDTGGSWKAVSGRKIQPAWQGKNYMEQLSFFLNKKSIISTFLLRKN